MRFSMPQIVVAATIAALVAIPSLAAGPYKHPAYLRALTDLRDARAHLVRAGSDVVSKEQENALVQVDQAIEEINHAGITDGKNISDHSPMDANLKQADRLHRAMGLLNQARGDVSSEQDQPDTQGLQKRVTQHIEDATRFTKYAAEAVH
jgi:hypothetical protein